MAAQLGKRSPSIDPDTASGLTVAGTTAMLLLRAAARLQAGDTLLVPAATGGVGLFISPRALRSTLASRQRAQGGASH